MKRRGKKTAFFALSLLFLFGFLFACTAKPVAYSFPHLIPYEESEDAPKRPINGASFPLRGFTVGKDDPNGEQLQFDELLEIAQDFARPDMTSDVSENVKMSYENAITILNRYIKNEWTAGGDDFLKVLTIYDYLAATVTYDYDLYLRYQNGEAIPDADRDSFGLAGVFLNQKAVCDGFAKAFVLLCAIEGIESVYVLGTFEGDLHAWNKVKLDGRWYNVDVTMGNLPFTVSGRKTVSVLNHAYFLRSDTMMYTKGGGHREGPQNQQPREVPPSAVSDYGFYETRDFAGIENCPMAVRNESELKDVFKKIRKSKSPRVGAIELKLDFSQNEDEPFEQLDHYSAAIAAAYKIAGFGGFSYTRGMQNPPFKQYPGGVFVFMVYP